MGRISPGLCGLGMHDRYIEENWKEEFINDLLISSTWDLSRTWLFLTWLDLTLLDFISRKLFPLQKSFFFLFFLVLLCKKKNEFHPFFPFETHVHGLFYSPKLPVWKERREIGPCFPRETAFSQASSLILLVDCSMTVWPLSWALLARLRSDQFSKNGKNDVSLL